MANSNGRGGPAPVLPATGLHSYHADSPPFSGATEMADPEPISLDSPRAPASMHSSAVLQPHPEHGRVVPVPALGANGHGHAHAHAHSLAAGAGPAPQSGVIAQLKGPSPSAGVPVGRHSPPVEAVRQPYNVGETPRGGSYPYSEGQAGGEGAAASTDTLTPAAGAAAADGEQSESATASRARNHRRVPTSSDDVNLSSSRSRRLVSGYLFGSPGAEPADAPASTGTADRPPISTRPSTSTSVYGDPHDPNFDALDDRLNGVGDGEADLDTTAVQAENGGSERYMRKEEEYRFPSHRLKRRMKDESKIPLVIVACGSFSPPTYLHLRMFEMAKDEIVESQTYEIMAGYYSPVSSYYKKAGLAPAHHRVRMCELAVEHTSTWLMVDPWEAGQPEYQRTAVVLDHFDEMLNSKEGGGGVEMSDGSRRKYKVMLLAGGDLIESFGEPGVWSEPDLHVILGRFGCLIVERAGSDVWAFLLSHDILYHHRKNVVVIKQLIYNDISSTKVRLFVRRGMSIKYLLPNSVANYIISQNLYRENEKALGK